MKVRHVTLLITAVLAGCGASGTQPHDMSAVQHQKAAGTLERSSREHEHRTDPGGTVCGGSTIQGSTPCWSLPSNQAAHEQEARRLHELAEKHRAAGSALAHAEVQACSGLSEADREVSPFLHRDDVASVAELHAAGNSEGMQARSGATIRFRPAEGLTLDWLGRAVKCHLARSAALGHSAELGDCPLAVRGAQAEVSSTSNGLEVAVWATDPASGAEVLRRAKKLREAPASR